MNEIFEAIHIMSLNQFMIGSLIVSSCVFVIGFIRTFFKRQSHTSFDKE